MTESNIQWTLSQVFGDKSPIEEITDVDLVSTVEFDHTGQYLAVGDRGGRVILFQQSKTNPGEFKFYLEFQSHEPEFDYLKSLEIEEKINKIKWLPPQKNGNFLLSTNDKTIKLWKIFNKSIRQLSVSNIPGSLSIPTSKLSEQSATATPRKTFSNGHAYHINSISLNSDGETFLSADDLRINLWNLGISDQSFNIVDIKPVNMDELSEVITATEFHPKHCNLFMYSSSRGIIKLADMRTAALCDNHAKIFEEEEDPGNKSFFSEIISSISDIKFTKDGRYIVSRDYLTLKIWDLNMESKPVKTIHIHDYLRSKLCDLYENDSIFDKFECVSSPDGKSFLTGSYHNYFNIYDINGKIQGSLEATKYRNKKTPVNNPKLRTGGGRNSSRSEMNPDTIDFGKKILHMAWHPTDPIVSIAAANNLFLYRSIPLSE